MYQNTSYRVFVLYEFCVFVFLFSSNGEEGGGRGAKLQICTSYASTFVEIKGDTPEEIEQGSGRFDLEGDHFVYEYEHNYND